MPNISRDVMIERLEAMRNEPLTEDQRDELILWDKGRSLAQMKSFNGWDVILEMLQSYPEKAIKELVNTDPASKDEVLANHAVAFAAHRIFLAFVADVDAAIEASSKTPEFVKQQLRSPAPIEATL